MNQLQRPIVLALVAFLLGLLPALRFSLPPLAPVIAFGGVLVFGLWFDDSRGRQGMAGSVWIFLVLAFAGVSVGSMARVEVEEDCRAFLVDDEPLELLGTLGAAHRSGAGGTGAPLLPLLDARVADRTGCVGEFRVRMPPGAADLAPGATITLSGHWRSFDRGTTKRGWPRDPRFQGFLRSDSLAFHPEATGAVSPLGLRARADERIARLFPSHLAMVEALLLGRREYMDREVRDRFARAGLSHLLAISGMHVGLLAGALLLVGSACRLSRRRAILLTLTITWIYLLVIGASASALRAGTMITVGLVAVILQRPAAALGIVAAAAFTILGLRPLAILDPGFQLSFAGVIGILCLRRPMLALLPHRLTGRGVLRAPIDAFVVGVAAFVTTAPIVAHHFGVVAPVSMLAGVPAVPVMSLALIGAVSALATEPFLSGLASIFAASTGVFLDLLDGIATMAAELPYAYATVGPPPWWTWSAAAAAGLITGKVSALHGKRLRWITGVGSTTVVLVVSPLFPGMSDADLEIHFIDVGQGDAVGIRTPGGRWVLVDAGPASATFDAGERQVVPFLRARGARRIEAIILTHPDLDHIGGAPAILSSLPARYVFEPGQAVGRAPYLQLLGAIDVQGAQWMAARSGRTLDLDGVRFEFLWPDSEMLDVYDDANQISTIVRVGYGDFSLLLTGDAGVEIEDLLAQRYPDLVDVTVLKLGHHGSATSTGGAFLDATSPELAVVSAGRRNRYGHPAPIVIDRVVERRIPIARTDREGTVSLSVSREGQEWRRKEW